MGASPDCTFRSSAVSLIPALLLVSRSIGPSAPSVPPSAVTAGAPAARPPPPPAPRPGGCTWVVVGQPPPRPVRAERAPQRGYRRRDVGPTQPPRVSVAHERRRGYSRHQDEYYGQFHQEYRGPPYPHRLARRAPQHATHSALSIPRAGRS